MKKRTISILLALVLCLSLLPSAALAADADEEVIISYELSDSYGDGWNINSIAIVDAVKGVTIQTLTVASGSSSEGEVTLIAGNPYSFIWNSGNYSEECSYVIKNGDDVILEGNGRNNSNGQVILTWVAAPYVPSPVTVFFEADGGEVSPKSAVLMPGGAYGDLPTPEKEGCVFDGWVLCEGGGPRLITQDYYGEYIFRLAAAEGDEAWDGQSPSNFQIGRTVVFDVTFNDVAPTGLEINDVDVDADLYTIDGSRISGRIELTPDYIRGRHHFMDILTDGVSSDYKVDRFYIIDPDSTAVITKDDTVSATNGLGGREGHALLAKWIPAYTVAVTAGEHMSLGIEDPQTVEDGEAIEDVVVTADEGFYFPEDYSIEAVNGVEVTRDSYTQITVSGTPTDDAEIVLADATEKSTPDAPAVGKTDCTTAAGDDGTITGVDETMEYQMPGDDEWYPVNGDTVTGLAPGAYKVRYKAAETSNASEASEVAILAFEGFTVSFDPGQGRGKMDEAAGVSGTYQLPPCGFEAPEGMIFKAWSVDGEEYEEDGTIEVTEDVTVTAVWEMPEAVYFITVIGGSPDKVETAAGETVTITADEPEKGMTFSKWTVVTGSAVLKNAKSSETTFTMPAGDVGIKAEFKKKSTGGTGSSSGSEPAPKPEKFKDVPKDAYYHDPVYWAVDKGITEGTSEDTFSPMSPTTRAQFVTFLYRAAGCPQVSGGMPFEDVPESAYYYKAVLWAYQNGVTEGTTPATFRPDREVTRAQVVTFLYRYAGEPEEGGANPFSDVFEEDYYYDAVLWAVEEGITEGTTPTTFTPDRSAKRAETVTMLYRFLAK